MICYNGRGFLSLHRKNRGSAYLTNKCVPGYQMVVGDFNYST